MSRLRNLLKLQLNINLQREQKRFATTAHAAHLVLRVRAHAREEHHHAVGHRAEHREDDGADEVRHGPRTRPRGSRALCIGQTLQGSFSAVSKPNFASKYAFESSRRDLRNALLCTALQSHFVLNFAKEKALNFAKFSNFSKMSEHFRKCLVKS